MAKLVVSAEEKAQMDSRGFTDGNMFFPETYIRRRYYDPRSDSWTKPLPADASRLVYYLKKGFLLEKPTSGVVKTDVEGEAVVVQQPTDIFQCPMCEFKSNYNTGLLLHLEAEHGFKKGGN